MKANLDDEQVAEYRRVGFIVVPDLLDATEVEHWRTVVSNAVGIEPSLAEGYYANVFQQRVNLWQRHPDVALLSLDRRLAGMAAQLMGVPSVRLAHDQALFKPPGGHPTSAHLDLPYWSFFSRCALTLWVALDDVDESNGAMSFLPGTHLGEYRGGVPIGEDSAALLRMHPEWASIPPVLAPMRAGSCSWHNALVAHSATANRTSAVRRAMTMQYAPADITYNGVPNALPPSYAASLSVGDPLDDDSVLPQVWPQPG